MPRWLIASALRHKKPTAFPMTDTAIAMEHGGIETNGFMGCQHMFFFTRLARSHAF
jgi:hypothetical protein